MKTVLLAGGLGTRMREETEFRPKPMVLIGNKPVLWHIMRSYAQYGFKEFVVCTGYKGELIRQYFRDFVSLNIDFTIEVGQDPKLTNHGQIDESGWKITVADTGLETMTGGRLFKIRNYIGTETFMCTYGDGLSNVDLIKLLEFHKKHKKIATMTAVRPNSRFGIVDITPDGIVSGFHEKPQTSSWVNGGFFVFEPTIFDYLDETCILEHEPLNKLAQEGQLAAYQHSDFWQPMDTYRESMMLNELWETGSAPWKNWK